MKDETIRLSPFVYIPETDIRFYLLILIGIVVPSFWAFIFGVIIWSVMGELQITVFLRLLIIAPIISIIPLLIYWTYRRFPKKIVRESKLKELDPEKFPDHWQYIGKLHKEYAPNLKQPVLMYQPLDPSESAFTFGTRSRKYIGASGGLIRKFRKNIDGFRAILLHELGHIVNKDVDKSYLAISTWRSLFFTLSIPLGILLIYVMYLTFGVFYLGILAGYDMHYIVSRMHIGQESMMLGGITLYFLMLLMILYVLRNQIVRLREFYADARVLEWEESPHGMIQSLKEVGGAQHSRFEMLTKFHPNIEERIHVLKNNTRLFTPSLWVAFSVGFFYGALELLLSYLKTLLFSISSWELTAMGSTQYQSSVELNVGFRASISVFIFTILMLAVSSSFHKLSMKDVFIRNVRYLSPNTALNVVTFSLAFSLGWLSYTMISFPQVVSLYETSALMGDLLDMAKAWIPHAAYFAIALFFLVIFSTMSIRRSFSLKEAERSFIIITLLSSGLYIANRFIAVELLDNKIFIILAVLIFSIVAYLLIKIKDRRLSCPNCSNIILSPSGLKLDCPKCEHSLYSWAIYSFSRRSGR